MEEKCTDDMSEAEDQEAKEVMMVVDKVKLQQYFYHQLRELGKQGNTS